MPRWGACHIQHNHEIRTIKNLVPALKTECSTLRTRINRLTPAVMESCPILLTFEFLLEARIRPRAGGIGTRRPPVVRGTPWRAPTGIISQLLTPWATR
jgi:hypothetical protein